ncbi:ParB/RepB/Spo0J family partition protein [Brevundimonas sanguinis]|uniref:ParB/RepB/Spo0J family partition protein n=1 Tax=Brevundimonas sanguinis TaxID=3021811 RepID=UPI002415916B|nr:ParB N-terminal domain-containing protein [Brevundimonas sp. NCCP 15609]
MSTALNLLAVQNAAVLRALRDRPDGGWDNVPALANHLSRDRSNLAKTLDKLEAEGLAAFNPLAHGLTSDGLAQLAMIDRAEGGAAGQGADPGASADRIGGVLFLTHAQILPDPANARRDWDSDEARDELDTLRQDILQNGLLQNLVVRGPEADIGGVRIADGQGDYAPLYTLVGGERRWRAIGEAITDGDWEVDTPIPCRLLETDDLGHRLAALAENLQRRNLNPLEKAQAFEALADAGLSNKEIADRVSCTPEHVQQHRRFLQLDEADQQRMTLATDDPRRLSVRDARQKLAKKSDQPAAIVLRPTARLALAEVQHATFARGGGMWASIRVNETALQSEDLQQLVALGALRHDGRAQYGKNAGWNEIGRGHTWPYPVFDSPLDVATGDAAARDQALRDEQLRAGHTPADPVDGEPAAYFTPWLADLGELSAEGQEIAEAARLREEANARERQRQDDERAQRTRIWAEARARHIRLLQAAHAAPVAGDPSEVAAIAADVDRPFPWRMLPNGQIVAANGATVKDRKYYGPDAPSDQELAINQMIVVAANTAAGFATPAVENPEPQADDEAADEADVAEADEADEDEDAA